MLSTGGCQQAPGKDPGSSSKDSGHAASLPPKPHTILQLFEESGSIDSLVILYFKDKLRFRYYTFYTTTDQEHLSLFKANLAADTASDTNCVKDGTIYCYIKGNIYTTLYFALSDSCRNLRLFKNGRLYNYPLDPAFQLTLKNLQRKSKEPQDLGYKSDGKEDSKTNVVRPKTYKVLNTL
jgi:hypothetical protein